MQGSSASIAGYADLGTSVVLNNPVKVAYEQDNLNLAQHEACKNLVTTLITGTTAAMGGDAATIETENNAAFIPIIFGILYLAGKAYTTYQIYHDLIAFCHGEKTLEQIALGPVVTKKILIPLPHENIIDTYLPTYRRHDISERAWQRIAPLLPGQRGRRGGIARDNRQFINAVFWILRTGSSWRDLPPDYGDWKNTHRRYCRWRDKHVWATVLDALTYEPDMEWLMIDATHIKVHAHGTGAVGGNEAMGHTKGGSIASCTWQSTPMECLSGRD